MSRRILRSHGATLRQVTETPQISEAQVNVGGGSWQQYYTEPMMNPGGGRGQNSSTEGGGQNGVCWIRVWYYQSLRQGKVQYHMTTGQLDFD